MTRPTGAIEYDPVDAAAVDGEAEAFDKDNPTHFQDVTPGVITFWIRAADGKVIGTIRGYAHAGVTGLTQGQANDRVKSIEIWGWRNTSGNGMASEADAKVPGNRNTRWELLYVISPSETGTNPITGEPSPPGDTSGFGVDDPGAICSLPAGNPPAGMAQTYVAEFSNNPGRTLDWNVGVQHWQNVSESSTTITLATGPCRWILDDHSFSDWVGVKLTGDTPAGVYTKSSGGLADATVLVH